MFIDGRKERRRGRRERGKMGSAFSNKRMDLTFKLLGFSKIIQIQHLGLLRYSICRTCGSHLKWNFEFNVKEYLENLFLLMFLLIHLLNWSNLAFWPKLLCKKYFICNHTDLSANMTLMNHMELCLYWPFYYVWVALWLNFHSHSSVEQTQTQTKSLLTPRMNTGLIIKIVSDPDQSYFGGLMKANGWMERS